MSKTDELVADLVGKDLTLARDYAGIVNWSVNKIQKWTDEWTDFSITDPGILFVNADGYLYDLCNYTLDDSYLNNILRYTKSMESLYFMSKLVGLELPSWESSTARVIVRNTHNRTITIPRDYPIFARDDATGEFSWFATLEEVVLPPNGRAEVDMSEGERKVLTVDNDGEPLTFDSFNDDFQFIIESPQVAINTVNLYAKVNGSDEWLEFKRIPDALLTLEEGSMDWYPTPTFSAHYAFDKTVIQLCPGAGFYLSKSVEGELVNSASEIKIVYSIPSGEKGNVGVLVANPGAPIYDQYNAEVQGYLKFTVNGATGGREPYSMEDTRVFIGNNSWRVDTLANTQDFNNLTLDKYPEIVRFVVKQNLGSTDMSVFFVPKSSVSAARILELQESLISYCTPLLFGGTQMVLKPIDNYYINISLDIVLGKNVTDSSFIRSEVKRILSEYLDRETQPENFILRRSAVIAQLEDQINEIQTVAFISPNVDIAADSNEILVLNLIDYHFSVKG